MINQDVIARIDVAALQHNLNISKQRAPHSAVLAMIKSNGYGHGLMLMAEALSSANALGVARAEEAFYLRQQGIKTPIVVMSGFINQQELELFCQLDIIAIIHQELQIALLETTSVSKPLSAWLKIDTGMRRLGFSLEVASRAYERLILLGTVKKPLGFMTHLADPENESYTRQQIQDFERVTADYSGPKSIDNSAGILRYPNAHCDWVRPGIMLYGVSPFLGRTGIEEGLKPVMTLQAKLIAHNRIKKNNTVGYGCTWSAPEDMPVGVVAIGYGDGYPRHARSGTPVLVQNAICPLIGRVSMNLITIDLRPFPKAAVGDKVTLWGEGLPAETVAASAGTIAYELFCNVTERVKYIEYQK